MTQPPPWLISLMERRFSQTCQAIGLDLNCTWDIGPYYHFKKKRGFGVTFIHPRRRLHIRLSKKLFLHPHPRADGIIRHELGHVVDEAVGSEELDQWALRRGIELPPPHLGEIRADTIALAIWGEPIRYDKDSVQNVRHGVVKRPRSLGW
jgi:hypothetical protein